MKRLVLVAACAALLAACGSQVGGAASAPPSASPATGTRTSGSAVVKAINFAFQPQALTVKVGTPVMFQNGDTTTHTFTANGGAFDSGRASPGQSFSFTFSSAGTFPFHCMIHSSMTGTITVTS